MNNLIELKNGNLALAIDRETGSIAKIADSTTGRLLVDGSGGRTALGRLFRIILPSTNWTSRFADSHTSGPPQIARRERELVLFWPKLMMCGEVVEVSARVTITLPEGADEARFALEIRNGSSGDVTDVFFPWIGGWRMTGAPAEHVVLFGGRNRTDLSFPKDGAQLHGGACHKVEVPFPTGAYLPWMDISGPEGGLSYVNWMAEPVMGKFCVLNLAMKEPAGNEPSFAWQHHPLIAADGSWNSTALGLAPHHGDWRVTADRYRRWVGGWHRAPHRNPQLRESIGYQNVFLRWFDGTPIHEISKIPELARAGRKYGVDHLMVWDYLMGGVYARHEDRDLLDYTEDQKAAFREAGRIARAEGVNLSGILNVLLANPTTSVYRNGGHGQVQTMYDGTPLSWSFVATLNHLSFWNTQLGPICQLYDPRYPEYQGRVLGYMRDFLAMGFASLFHDQPFAHMPSYNRRDMGDSPDSVHRARIDLIARMRRMIHENDAGGYMLGEYTDPWASQHIDISLSWYDRGNAQMEELERIAFSAPFVIHSYPVDQRKDLANRAFANGFQLWLCTHCSEGTLADAPDFGEHVRKLAALRKKTARRTVHALYEHTLGLKTEKTDGIVAYAYRSAEGPAVVAASVGKDGRARIEIDQHAFPGQRNRRGVLYRLDGTEEPAGVDGCLELALSENDVVVWYP